MPKTVDVRNDEPPVESKAQDPASGASASPSAKSVPLMDSNNGASAADLPSARTTTVGQSAVVDKGIF